MNLIERLKAGVAAFKGTGGMELPANGRSSDETLSGSMGLFLQGFSSINPVISFEMLKTLKCLWLYNPDISQYVANIVNMGNPGHSLSVDAGNDAAAEAAVNRLNESASRLYTIGCGVDGLLNQYLTSIAWSGAISSEDVVNLAARRVEKVVLVPVEQIRFRYNQDLDIYEPYQRTNGLSGRQPLNQLGLIKLNTETYKYFALSTVENSPYAKPPATAAVEPIIEAQKPIMDNLRYVAQKFGLLGLVAASVTPPSRKPGESESEYQTRAAIYLTGVTKSLEGNFSKGLITAFKDIKLEHTSVAEGGSGLYDANRMSEEQVMSGTHMPPVFYGRTDSSTETFADVVYSILVDQVANIQRIAKRRQEQTYMLDLRLGGTNVDGVSLQFNKAHSRNALAEAQTDQIHIANVITKVEKGVISPDEGAAELGYESWFDLTALGAGSDSGGNLGSLGVWPEVRRRTAKGEGSIKLSFDVHRQKYIYQPEMLSVSDLMAEGSDAEDEGREAADNVAPFIKKKRLTAYN